MPYIYNDKTYSKRDFWQLLFNMRQTIAFNQIPKYMQKRLLDGDDIKSAIINRRLIYVRKRDNVCFAVTSA